MKRTLLALAFPAAMLAQQPMHLTLADAQRIAVQTNPQYSSAKFTAAAIHQQPSEYRAAEFPSLSGLLTGVGADNGTRLAAGALNNPAVYSRIAGGVVASQLITDFGRTHNLVGMSNLQAQASDQAGEATRADVLLGATRAYFDVLRAQAVLKVAQQTVAARQLVSDQITALAQSQLRTQLDVSFANVNLSDAKLLQLQAENGINSAEAELATALGLPNQTTFDVVDEPMPAELPTQADTLIAQAMQNRPDLKNLQLLQSAAERFTRAEHDLYYPTVNALVAAGGVPAGEPQIAGHYAAAGVNVNIPVFNGGLFKARESEAALRAKAAINWASALSWSSARRS
jgi:outer membrane protein